VYLFNADGSGLRGTGEDIEQFDWIVEEGLNEITLTLIESYERWLFEINEGTIIMTLIDEWLEEQEEPLTIVLFRMEEPQG
jgi:hypothetical protein